MHVQVSARTLVKLFRALRKRVPGRYLPQLGCLHALLWGLCLHAVLPDPLL